MKAIKIDSRVSGYKGPPVRILAVCDIVTGAVLVSKTGDYNTAVKPTPDTVVVTDSPESIKDWQLAYDERQHMVEVVKAYFEMQRSGRIRLDTSLLRYNPDGVIQTRKIDERGANWEFDTSATENGHIAVMLAVWAAKKSIQGNDRADMMDDEDESMESEEEDDSLPFSL